MSLVVLFVVAAAALGWGIAQASVPSSGGTFYACSAKSNGALRVIDYPTKKCTSKERLLSWQRLTWRGAWSASTSYTGGSLATRGGSTWLALRSGKAHTPAAGSPYWGLFAAHGSTGPQGGTGPQGPQGGDGKGGTGDGGVRGLGSRALLEL